jgi:hypothetical protein
MQIYCLRYVLLMTMQPLLLSPGLVHLDPHESLRPLPHPFEKMTALDGTCGPSLARAAPSGSRNHRILRPNANAGNISAPASTGQPGASSAPAARTTASEINDILAQHGIPHILPSATVYDLSIELDAKAQARRDEKRRFYPTAKIDQLVRTTSREAIDAGAVPSKMAIDAEIDAKINSEIEAEITDWRTAEIHESISRWLAQKALEIEAVL